MFVLRELPEGADEVEAMERCRRDVQDLAVRLGILPRPVTTGVVHSPGGDRPSRVWAMVTEPLDWVAEGGANQRRLN